MGWASRSKLESNPGNSEKRYFSTQRLPNYALLGVMAVQAHYYDYPFLSKPPSELSINEFVGSVMFISGTYNFLRLGYGILTNTASSNQQLQSTGQYALNRHPIYTSFIIASIGETVSEPSWENLMYTSLVGLTAEVTVRFEEKYLERHYANEYAGYMEKVPRWIPRQLSDKVNLLASKYMMFLPFR